MLDSTRATGPLARMNRTTAGSADTTASFAARSPFARKSASRKGRSRSSSRLCDSKSSKRSRASAPISRGPPKPANSAGARLAGSDTARGVRELKRVILLPQAFGETNPARAPSKPNRSRPYNQGVRPVPLASADLRISRVRSLALANGEAWDANALGCDALAAIAGSIVSPRRRGRLENQSTRLGVPGTPRQVE